MVTEHAIAMLRDQLAGLLAQIDTGSKPRPTVITNAPERNAGAVWHPVPKWVVRTLDDDTSLNPTCVYVTTPEHYLVEAPDDFDAVRTDDARRLAMALLAAADWADGLAADVVQLDGRRGKTNPSRKEISR